jgi:hypothetical protein
VNILPDHSLQLVFKTLKKIPFFPKNRPKINFINSKYIRVLG